MNRELPSGDARWQPYHFRGTVRCKKREEGERVQYKTFEGDGSQINWEGHASPDMLPTPDKLHPTMRRIYEVMLHRAYANMMVDIKISNEELVRIVGRSPRMVAYHLAELTRLGFIGICHVTFGVGKQRKTWRMIRMHAAGFLMQWETWESPTWFITDYRPDSQRAPGKPRDSYNARVALSGRLPPGWGLRSPEGRVYDRAKKEFVVVKAKIDVEFGPIFTGLRQGYITSEWYGDHQTLLDEHDYDDPVAKAILGRSLMSKDLNDPQLIR